MLMQCWNIINHTRVWAQKQQNMIYLPLDFAWFADSLANTNLIWVWLAKIIVYVVRFLPLVWVVCNLLINDKHPLDRQVWRAHWSSSSVSVWLRVGNLLAVSCLLSALPEVWWVKKCAECAGSRKVLRVQESLLKYFHIFHLVSFWLFNYNSCTLHSKSVQLKVWKHLVTGFSQCLSAFQEAHWVCRNVEV